MWDTPKDYELFIEIQICLHTLHSRLLSLATLVGAAQPLSHDSSSH